jgi:hypothetical protein
MTMRCSFCRRHDSKVEKLVAGPRGLLGRVYICDRCAEQTVAIMEGSWTGDSAPRQRESLLRRLLRRVYWRKIDFAIVA